MSLGLNTLGFVGPHVAASRVARVRTRLPALVSLQHTAAVVGAAGRIARVDGRTARRQGHGLGRPAVVLQRPELRLALFRSPVLLKLHVLSLLRL